MRDDEDLLLIHTVVLLAPRSINSSVSCVYYATNRLVGQKKNYKRAVSTLCTYMSVCPRRMEGCPCSLVSVAAAEESDVLINYIFTYHTVSLLWARVLRHP